VPATSILPVTPSGYAELREQRNQYTTDTWLEINELMNADKMIEG
jgi:hypothetical protein